MNRELLTIESNRHLEMQLQKSLSFLSSDLLYEDILNLNKINRLKRYCPKIFIPSVPRAINTNMPTNETKFRACFAVNPT